MHPFIRDRAAAVSRRLPLPGRWRLVSWLAGGITRPTPVVVDVPGVGRMELDLASGLEREIYVTGTHGDEAVIADRLREHLARPGAVFVDVGANVGYHAVAQGRRLRDLGGAVYAFEPIAANYRRLVTNIRLNDLSNVRAVQAGLWDSEGTLEVGRSVGGSGNVSFASEGGVRERVQLLRFDDWAEEAGLERLDVLKMDIEGAEVNALRGMTRSLERHRPVLVVEINPMWTRRMGTSTTELIDLLHGLGYALYECHDRSAGARPAKTITRVDPDGTSEVNVVGVPRPDGP